MGFAVSLAPGAPRSLGRWATEGTGAPTSIDTHAGEPAQYALNTLPGDTVMNRTVSLYRMRYQTHRSDYVHAFLTAARLVRISLGCSHLTLPENMISQRNGLPQWRPLKPT